MTGLDKLSKQSSPIAAKLWPGESGIVDGASDVVRFRQHVSRTRCGHTVSVALTVWCNTGTEQSFDQARPVDDARVEVRIIRRSRKVGTRSSAFSAPSKSNPLRR